ncbi:MAG: prolipoprotein diacylglyceryl transferase [Myxococcales bacterium]
MFPYLQEPVLHVAGFSIAAFQVLVFAAVVFGYEITVRRAARLGWKHDDILGIGLWAVFLGFVGSHLFDTLLYEREALRQNPLVLLEFWGTMSSYGGLIGGVGGGLLALRLKRFSLAQTLSFFDITAFAFPFAWIFGRTGCALAHDHVGVETTSFLAVRFPGGPRYDLGLLELIWTIVICAVFLLHDRKPRPTGFYVAYFLILYAPVRFALDMLRIGDERYLGWTPGQYASLAAVAAGLALLQRLREPAKSALRSNT